MMTAMHMIIGSVEVLAPLRVIHSRMHLYFLHTIMNRINLKPITMHYSSFIRNALKFDILLH
jgi:hypothetical protein